MKTFNAKYTSLFAMMTLGSALAACAADATAEDGSDGRLGVTTNETVPSAVVPEEEAQTTVQQKGLPILVHTPTIGEPVWNAKAPESLPPSWNRSPDQVSGRKD